MVMTIAMVIEDIRHGQVLRWDDGFTAEADLVIPLAHAPLPGAHGVPGDPQV